MEDLRNQITNKAGFLIYTDYWEKYFSKMTGEQVKEVFKIIFHFNLTFEVLKTNDLAVEMVVATIIDNIKRDAIKRTKQSIASAKNGKLGGRPKQNKSKTEANVNDNVNLNQESKSKRFVKPTLDEVKQYCIDRNNNIDADKFMNYYDANGWKIGKNPMKDWKACIRNWESNTNKANNTNNNKPTSAVYNQDTPRDYHDTSCWK